VGAERSADGGKNTCAHSALAIADLLATLRLDMFRARGPGVAAVLSLLAGVACSGGESPPGNASAGTGSSAAVAGAGGGGTTSGGTASAGGNNNNNNNAGGSAGGVTGGASTVAGAGGVETGPGGGGAGGSPSVTTDTVTKKTSTFAFKHYATQTTADGVWNGPETLSGQPIETMYETTVLENAYLRVTILPSWGGRVLSIVHKPTGRELLYQNPVGTPYLMKQGIFYYDYLVIMGGIFPSFPEPEHGRYWNQPYEFEVVSEKPEAITVRMSRKDDKDVAAGVPTKYNVGRTDVLVQLEVTLRAGSAALEINTKLTNTRTTPVQNFEYWTVTTLAPGSKPGETKIPLETRILAKMDKVRLLTSDWDWFKTAETNVEADVYQFKNLASFKNWTEEGTAFANPQYSANWSGLANDTNGTNILRVSENKLTPGLKLWTFGVPSLTADISKSDVWLRPAIEMWHGVTPEFWKRGTLAAGEVRTWTDRYFATLGLPDITAASEQGALYLSSARSGADVTLDVAASLNQPDQMLKAVLRLNGNVVASKDVMSAAAGATKVSATVPSAMAPAGAMFEAEFLQGDKSLLKGQVLLK
jgi:hypothetical protein